MDVGADRAVVLVPARARGPDAPIQVVDDVGEIELAPPVGEGALRSLCNRGLRDLVVVLAVCGEQIQRVAPGMLAPVVRARDLAAAKDAPIRDEALLGHSLHDAADPLAGGGNHGRGVNRKCQRASLRGKSYMPEMAGRAGPPPRPSVALTAVGNPETYLVDDGLWKRARLEPSLGWRLHDLSTRIGAYWANLRHPRGARRGPVLAATEAILSGRSR